MLKFQKFFVILLVNAMFTSPMYTFSLIDKIDHFLIKRYGHAFDDRALERYRIWRIQNHGIIWANICAGATGFMKNIKGHKLNKRKNFLTLCGIIPATLITGLALKSEQTDQLNGFLKALPFMTAASYAVGVVLGRLSHRAWEKVTGKTMANAAEPTPS